MSDILNKNIVLVLNRNWQAINIRTPADAFCQMATNVATALDIEFNDEAESDSFRTPHSALRVSGLRPVTWDEWITLPIRDGDNLVRTARGAIRVPTVIVAVNFANPRHFSAYIHTLRWNCVTATDPKIFQAPFRAGIRIDA